MREVLKLWWVWYFSAILVGCFAVYLVDSGWKIFGWFVMGLVPNMAFKAGQLKVVSNGVASVSEVRRET
jgi:hypothetical protein